MTKFSVRDSTTISIYIQCKQGSYGIIGMYLFDPRIKIVPLPNTMRAVRKFLNFIQRSASYHRTAERCS
jgi:hypothetical protein